MTTNAKPICVLGIESSCDETAIGIYHETRGLIANEVHSQIELHAKHGGVVPELASRDHIRKMIPVLNQALTESELSIHDITHIAYTAGPGLVGALLVGASFAKSLAKVLNIPAIPTHHMEGHLLAPLLSSEKPQFPFLGLLVSGGHTMLVKANSIGDYELLGESLDDAVGEAFDKTAKLLGLGYPGGPAIAKLALEGESNVYEFPRPMMNRPGLDFSFSGLKTFVLNTYETSDKSEQTKANIAKEFEQTVVRTLTAKCKRAMLAHPCKHLVVAGGVSANRELRNHLDIMTKELNGAVLFPELKLCTDNGGMIAFAAFLRLDKEFDDANKIQVKPRWDMVTL